MGVADHPIPMFCAGSLVDYGTQNAPDLVGFLQAKAEQDLSDIKIDPYGRSKRLSPEALERYWERDTQGASSEWPPWLKQDSVLRRMKQQDQRDDYREAIKNFWEAKARNSAPSSIFTEDRSDVKMSDATRPSTPTGASYSGGNQSIKAYNGPGITEQGVADSLAPSNKPNAIRTAQQRSKPKLKTTKMARTQLTRPSGVRKNMRTAMRQEGEGIVETRRTRSRNVTKFYELDATSTARTYRSYR